MEVVRHTDPGRFLTRVGPWLESAEAHNNLILGIVGTLADRPETYEEFALWSVGNDDSILAAASITPPFNLVVAESVDRAAVDSLARAVRDDRQHIPGVLANRPTVDWFVTAWREIAGVDATLTLSEGVFCLETVRDVARPDGRPRSATLRDMADLMPQLADFQAEALPHEERDAHRIRRLLEMRLDEHAENGMWVWDLGGKIVSLSGYGGRTPNGIRIGPVYTPPQHRGKGYATALVAAQSRWLLDNGRQFCFLYTDRKNPTSNAIYQRIGYRLVTEAEQWTFTG